MVIIYSGATAAREKHTAMLSRLTVEATKLFEGASYSEKSQDPELAMRGFERILELMLPGDEIRDRAARQLEALKR